MIEVMYTNDLFIKRKFQIQYLKSEYSVT